jgi:hypothetical protein
MFVENARRARAEIVICTVMDGKRKCCNGHFGPCEDYKGLDEKGTLERGRTPSPGPDLFSTFNRTRYVSTSPGPANFLRNEEELPSLPGEEQLQGSGEVLIFFLFFV